MDNLSKRINVGPWINVGHEQNMQIYITKKLLKLKISTGKNAGI